MITPGTSSETPTTGRMITPGTSSETSITWRVITPGTSYETPTTGRMITPGTISPSTESYQPRKSNNNVNIKYSAHGAVQEKSVILELAIPKILLLIQVHCNIVSEIHQAKIKILQ